MGDGSFTHAEVLVGLENFQVRLRDHFDQLADQRRAAGAVVFALEHGLDADSLQKLDTFVRAGVRGGMDFDKVWLPFVVYATEIGYAYDGNEFWDTFEKRTPSWQDRYDRESIRYLFSRFTRTFCGAQPKGAWAEHFSIISWPITHAVLPEDLQLKLVKIIHEVRYQLREEHLSNPEALGQLLGGRADQFPSSRIRILLENEPLVGQIATALLHADSESKTDLLEPQVLERLAAAFQEKSNASQLLKSAQKAATRVRYRAVAKPGGRGTTSSPSPDRASPQQIASVLGIEPRLVARMDQTGAWGLFGQFPRLNALAERFTPIMAALRSTQFRVNGSSRTIGRSALLFGPQSVPITSLPDPTKPALIGPDTANLLSLYVRGDWNFLASNLWMFKLGADRVARFVRSPIFRPGDEYLIVSREEIDLVIPFARPASIHLDGTTAYVVSIPLQVDPESREALERSTGWPVGSFLAMSPYGLPPLSWDGQGSGEWIEDTPIMLAISHEKSPAIVSIDLQDMEGTLRNEALVDSSPNLLIIEGLEAGRYNLALTVDDDSQPAVEGHVELQIVEKSALDHEEAAINLLIDPPHSGFEDLWSNRAKVLVAGPVGLEVAIDVILKGGRGSDVIDRFPLGKRRLPLQASNWAEMFTQLRDKRDLAELIEESASCVVVAQSPVFRAAELVLERRASPIRLKLRKRDGKSVLELFNDTSDNEPLSLAVYEFESPSLRSEIPVESGHRSILEARPGLVVAKCGKNEVSLIIPPEVHDLFDLRQSLRPIRPPSIPTTLRDLREAVALAALWSEGDTGAHVLSDGLQGKVLEAWSRAVVLALAGQHWVRLEESVSGNGIEKLKKYLVDHPLKGSAMAAIQSPEFDGMIQSVSHRGLPKMIDEQVFMKVEARLPASLRSREKRLRTIRFGLLLTKSPHLFNREAAADGLEILATLINFPQIVRLCRLCEVLRSQLLGAGGGSS